VSAVRYRLASPGRQARASGRWGFLPDGANLEGNRVSGRPVPASEPGPSGPGEWPVGSFSPGGANEGDTMKSVAAPGS